MGCCYGKLKTRHGIIQSRYISQANVKKTESHELYKIKNFLSFFATNKHNKELIKKSKELFSWIAYNLNANDEDFVYNNFKETKWGEYCYANWLYNETNKVNYKNIFANKIKEFRRRDSRNMSLEKKCLLYNISNNFSLLTMSFSSVSGIDDSTNIGAYISEYFIEKYMECKAREDIKFTSKFDHINCTIELFVDNSIHACK